MSKLLIRLVNKQVMTTACSILQSCKAGLAYFAGVFVLAFLFGILRRMFLVSTVGELVAVLVEVLILLAFSSLIARRIVFLMSIPAFWPERLMMGSIAFVVLMFAEFVLSVAVLGNTVAIYLSNFQTPQGVIGLAGQVIFALIPLLLIINSQK